MCSGESKSKNENVRLSFLKTSDWCHTRYVLKLTVFQYTTHLHKCHNCSTERYWSFWWCHSLQNLVYDFKSSAYDAFHPVIVRVSYCSTHSQTRIMNCVENRIFLLHFFMSATFFITKSAPAMNNIFFQVLALFWIALGSSVNPLDMFHLLTLSVLILTCFSL